MFLKPDYIINGDITDIDLDMLAGDGIEGLILDLDSTLVEPKSASLTNEAAQWLERARARFRVAVVSNNKNEVYLAKIQTILCIPVIFRAAKPSRKAFRSLMKEFNLQANQIAVVGDRPLTDIWGGQRSGMKTVLVRILKSQKEPRWKTSIRNMERLFIRHN